MTFWQSALKLMGDVSKWPSWVGWLVVLAAFLLGIGSDAVGSSSHTVNILAPPLLLLMLWNLAVYAFIAVNALSKSRHFKLPKLDQTEAMALARGTTVMHWAAATLALGALLAMYWRGLVFDYQALWQSTFLSAQSAHSIIGFVLSPAAWLAGFFGGMPFPDLASFEQLRAPTSQGENAARWIHWYAITVFLVVLLPRCLLALWSHQKTQQLQNAALKKTKPQIAPSATTLQTEPITYSSIQTIALSLVAHTNVGKTTLARTLLGRDIGEVRDAEHVTHTAERHVLVEAQNLAVLERLELWDTPGFGDSELLAKRMSQAGNPIGWFMSEVWDRLQNRAFWYSQRAVRHILDESDVVLYLINTSENPAKNPDQMAYLDAELKVLDLIGKPVVVLLNQVADHNGVPTTPELAEAELQRWKTRVSKAKCVKDVLLLDAFTRCWVQEGRLLEAVATSLDTSLDKRKEQFSRLSTAWQQRNLQRWQASMNVLAQRLCRAACDKEIVLEAGWSSKLKEAGVALGKAMGLSEGDNTPKALAMKALSKRLDADIRSNMDELIALHQLDGRAGNMLLTRLAEHYAVQSPQSEGKAALWGGVVTGALMGLKADILSGGLTLGGGMLAGGVLGALGAAGLARGYNQVKGIDTPTLAWTPQVLDDLTRSALLGYLAVAHFGRGRGEWTEVQPPAFWVERIEAALAPQWVKLHAIWEKSSVTATTAAFINPQAEMQVILLQTSQAVLQSLYPDAGQLA